MEVTTSNLYEEVEEGEISDSSDDYTPLQRPQTNQPSIKIESMATEVSNVNENSQIIEEKMRDADDSISDFGQSSDSSSDSDDCMKTRIKVGNENLQNFKKDKRKRTVLVRVKPTDAVQNNKKAKFKKYDIWAQSLQEDSLMENMRGIDVAKNKSDRNVENYDFSLKYRLNGENTLKRRLSTSGDDMSDGSNSRQYYQSRKRTKSSGRKSRQEKRPNKKHNKGRGRSASSCDSHHNLPRNILDLNIQSDTPNEDVARDIANKLYEEKDDLLLRIVQVLGKELPIQLFKETQKIEKDGGMMIINGKRRRTPGGVFLFLLKHNESISPDDRRKIFIEERKVATREHKQIQAMKRNKKVEELKKCLNEREKEFNSTTKNKEISRTLLKPESLSLSNPPPSPVANGCPELSPEYKPPAIINHVADTQLEKLLLAKASTDDLEDESLTAYDDDFLDMHCDDMELM